MLALATIFFMYLVFKGIKFFYFPNNEKYYYNEGKPLSVGDKKVFRENMKQHIRDFPTGTMTHVYPDIAREVFKERVMMSALDNLQKLHRTGQISDLEYQNRLEKLVDLVDISELQN